MRRIIGRAVGMIAVVLFLLPDIGMSPVEPARLDDCPECNVSPTMIHFNSGCMEGGAEETFTVSNTGTEMLQISEVSSSNPAFTVQPGGGVGISPGGSATFMVTFACSGSGDEFGTISFTTSSPCGSINCGVVNVSGNCPPIVCDIDRTSIHFSNGCVEGGTEEMFEVTNNGDEPFHISTVESTNPAFNVEPGGGVTLDPGNSATFTVTFTCGGSGDEFGTISFETDSMCGLEPKDCGVVNVSGNCSAAACAISPSMINFGTICQGSEATQTFSVNNTGDQLFTIVGVFSSNQAFTVDPSGATINPDSSATFMVTFTCSGSAEEFSTITFSTDSLCGVEPEDCGVVNVSGSCLLPAATCEVSPPTIEFGAVCLGDRATRTITVSNSGDRRITVEAVESTNPAFTVRPARGVTINPGGSARFAVTLTNTGLDDQLGMIEFDASNDCGPIDCDVVTVRSTCELDELILYNLLEDPRLKPPCGCSGGGSRISLTGRQCAKCGRIGTYYNIRRASGKRSVFLHNGEFSHYEVDLEIPGRGFNWKFERTYRSGIIFNGPLGHNWEFNYNRRLFVVFGGDVLRMDGFSRADAYTLNGDGGFTAPPGFYTSLVMNPNGTFSEREPNGTKVEYSQPDEVGIARMTEIHDQNGNRMQFEYNAQGRLVRVIDTLGRAIDYSYNGQGRLIAVRDFSDRSIRFEYDENGDLVAVTSPAVEGTPNGNDFPKGKTTRYTYSSGFDEEVLNHNMLTITAPNEVASGGEPRIRLEYANDLDSPDMDRVLTQTIGATNAPAKVTGGQISFRQDVRIRAGGAISYEYEFLGLAPEDDFITAVTQTAVTDRNGNQTEYQFNQLGNIVRIREFTNRNIRGSDPEFFETRYEYNRDGEMTRMIYPEGNSLEYVYDDQTPDRFRQGNLLAEIRRPNPERGGDQEFIKTTYTYEPIYNQVRTVTEARGNDPNFVPQNGGANSPERYTTVYVFDYQEGEDFRTLGEELGLSRGGVQRLLRDAGIPMGLGDVNGDGRTDQIAGNVVRVEYPTVNLLPASNLSQIEGGAQQPIVEFRSFNQFGQMTRSVDPEGNVTVKDYHPENDPDGDRRHLTPNVSDGPFGYLKEEIRDAESDPIRNSRTDPEPTHIRMQYFYDLVGNVIREVDGRGIATNYVVNELNQVVQTVHAAAHNVFAPDPPEPLPLEDFQYLERIFYDFNNNVVRHQFEDHGNTSNVGGNNGDSGTAFADYEYKYDILDNKIEVSEEVSHNETLITRYRYDPNENQVLVIQPEGNATASVYDERDLVFQRTRGAVSPPSLGHLAAGDATNYDVRGGEPSTMTYHYDLNRNFTEEVDAADTDGSAANNSKQGGVGDRTRYIYDGFDRRTSVVDSVGSQTVTQYDPASNAVRISRFGPLGGESPASDGPNLLPIPVSTGGVIQAANLVNDNLLVATENLYDELSRVFQTNRVLFVNTVPTIRPPDVADGASDIGKGNLTPGDNQGIPGIAGVAIIGRVTTRTEYDRNSRRTFTVEDDTDTSRTFYDGTDRVTKMIDPEGNAVETAYDDKDNVIETREMDVSQIPGVLDEVFLTTNVYDSLNRLERKVDNIGQTFDYRYDSRNNLVAMADAQGSAGPTIARRAFGGGALTNNTTNRFGNVTLYFYDGTNRRTREEKLLTTSGEGDGINIGTDLFGVKTATPSPDPSQGGGDGLITMRTEWDRNSLLASVTDDNGNQTRYTYDNLNRRLTETKGICVPPALADRCDPPTTITIEYDPDDNVVHLRDENGSVIGSQYDAINRRLASNIGPAPGVVGTTATLYEYDGLSRLTRAADNNELGDPSDDSTITRAYDSLSRVIEETQQIGDLPAKAVSSAWRAGNLRSVLTYPNGRELKITFDRLDRTDLIADNGQRITDKGPIVDYDYIGKQRVLQRRYPISGTRLTYMDDAGTTDVGYDGLRRPAQLRHLRTDNSLVVGFSHTYDRMNNKLIEEKLHSMGDSELYRYDSVYRLVRFERGSLNTARDNIAVPSSNVPLHRQWTLDGAGNWQRVDSETRRHSSFNEIIERGDGSPTSVLSDDNGNETDDGTFAFGWDYRNRLRAVTRKVDGAVVAVYSYDAAGRRIRKVVTNSGDSNNGTTNFFYDRWQVIEERDRPDALVQQYVYGVYIDEPLVLDRNLDGGDSATGSGDQRLFYHQNTLYSVFALTDTGGHILEGYQYEAYGRPTLYEPGPNSVVNFGGDDVVTLGGVSALGNPYIFTGRRLDAETGTYYYRTRYLDPVAGRFTTRDLLGIWGDASALGNGYTAVRNAPSTGLDPMGTRTEGARCCINKNYVEEWETENYKSAPACIADCYQIGQEIWTFIIPDHESYGTIFPEPEHDATGERGDGQGIPTIPALNVVIKQCVTNCRRKTCAIPSRGNWAKIKTRTQYIQQCELIKKPPQRKTPKWWCKPARRGSIGRAWARRIGKKQRKPRR